jgi:hypothetical protein
VLFQPAWPQQGSISRKISVPSCNAFASAASTPVVATFSSSGPQAGPPCWHLFETRVIPHIATIDQAEEALDSGLVAVVGGTRPAVPPSRVLQLLGRHYTVHTDVVQVKHYSDADFPQIFASRKITN